MKYVKVVLALLLLTNNISANEDMSKLNSLYLNGVLDKNTYFTTIQNMGIDTSNEIFLNLFDLFSDNVLDLNSYESSLKNLLSVANNSEVENTSAKVDKNDNNSTLKKRYILSNCKGNSNLCDAFAEAPLVFEFSNGKVSILESNFDELLNDVELLRIVNIKTLSKNNNFDIVVGIAHAKGFIINFSFGGMVTDNQFEMIDVSVKARNKELLSGDLVLL
jgi:hypothetical protein